MTRFLKLYNTFTRCSKNVVLSGKLISCNQNDIGPTLNGSLYICGPTVYSDSHLGHALTYVRADLLRRFMKSLFKTKLITVMNITDVDDKILDKTRKIHQLDGRNFSEQPHLHPFNKVSEKYYKSFLDDMRSIRVLPADLYVRVSKHIHLITNFIRKLEQNGNAYISETGDVHFRVDSLKNYIGRTDSRKSHSSLDHRNDPRDFVLWKSAKPGEPTWSYESADGQKVIPGRPGWHVQCSAISSALFGSNLDFHFGGKDLIFPHHYNEEACCCAYHNLDTSESLHVWSKNWLHSGHLKSRDFKMSKSLGNVILISDFIKSSSVNVLRLLCIHTHYRSDFELDDELLGRTKAADHRLSAFVSFLNEELRKIQENLPFLSETNEENLTCEYDVEAAVIDSYNQMLDGICDDFHLDRGLESILSLSKFVYARVAKMKPKDLILVRSLLENWFEMCGLEYASMGSSTNPDNSLLDLLSNFRQEIRLVALSEAKKKDITSSSLAKKLLEECDKLRCRTDDLGFVLRDPKT